MKKIINNRLLMFLAAGFGLGVLLFRLIPNDAIFVTSFTIAVSAVLLAMWRKPRLALVMTVLFFGLLRAYLSYPSELNDGKYFVSGTVRETSGGVTVIGDVSIDGARVDKYVLLKSPGFNVDDVVSGHISLDYVNNVDDTDYRCYLLSENYIATSDDNKVKVTAHKQTANGALNSCRIAISNKIHSILKPDTAPLAEAILLGVKDNIQTDNLLSVRKAGIAHLFALSGLHVSIITGALMFVLRRLNRRSTAVVICLFLLCYCAITAFPASLVRASIMCALFVLSKALGRRNDTLTTLSAAFIFILIVNPFQLFAAGFVMSFSAVLGILFLFSPLSSLLTRVFLNGLSGSIATSVGATLGTLPATLGYFGRFSLYGVITNIVAIPLASVAVISGFCATIIAFISEIIAFPFAVVADAGLYLLILISDAIAALPLSQIELTEITWPSGLAFMVTLALCSKYVFITKNQRFKAVAFSLMIAILLLLLF